MKKQIHLALTVFVTLILISVIAKAQTINIDAAVKYWELTDSLKHNKPITDAGWEKFINIDGNKTYVHSVFDSASLAGYRKALEMVYMPKNEAWLKKNLEAKYWYAILVKRYKDQEDSLKTYLQQTLKSPAYRKVMYKYVYAWLPKKAHHEVNNLKFYYNGLGMDAVSYPNGIFISLMSASNNSKIKNGILEAHELHHQLRPQLEFKEVQPAHKGILYAIRSIQNEGIADMIDKEPTYNLPGDPEELGDWLIKWAPAAIRKLDSALIVMARSQGSTFESEKYYRQVLRSSAGHMPGFYMARAIVHNGLKKPMIKQAYDPFAFIYLYNQAAKKDATHPPVFSDEAIAYLKQLEKQYRQ